MNITHEDQFMRRKEMLEFPHKTATGSRTAGLGTSGNTEHLNLETPLHAFPKPKHPNLPRQLRRAAIINELASLGRSQYDASIILGVEPSTVFRICKRFGIEMRGKRGPKPWLRNRIMRDYRHGISTSFLAERYGTSPGSVSSVISKLKASGALV
jgi:hypothetical protein